MKRQVRHEDATNASSAEFENARQALRGEMELSYHLGE
jgi:hypothetical protein